MKPIAFRIFLFALILLLPIVNGAQKTVPAKIPRVLFLLDGSSSMIENWDASKSRFKQAEKVILALMDSLTKANSQVEFGLRVFGHQYPAQEKNCFDTKLEIQFLRGNESQMQARLESLQGLGVSPIAYSLSQAANEDFENENKYAYSIILLTDGGESCNGDICKVVQELLQKKIFFKPYIVSMLDYAPLKETYKCLGTLLTISKEEDLIPVISKITEAHREGFERTKTGKKIDVLPVIEKKASPIDTSSNPVSKVEKVQTKADTLKITFKTDSVISKPKSVVQEKTPPLIINEKKQVVVLKLNTKLKAYKTIVVERPSPKLTRVPIFELSKVGDAPPEVKEPIVEKVEIRELIKMIKYLPYSKKKKLSTSLSVVSNPSILNVPPFVLSKFDPIVASPIDTIVIPITIPKVVQKETTNVQKEPIKEEPKLNQPVVVKKEIVKPNITQQAINKKNSAAESQYEIKVTPSVETEVQVYFTDGRGKFYHTTPQIQLSDPKSSKSIKTFYRYVNADGEPDAISVPAGVFNLSVVGSDRTFLKNIEIKPNMKNNIVITVGGGSLQFVWKTGDKKKPVDKFSAQVKRNFVPQPMVTQRCDTVLPYPPGNYHVEINTLPVSVRSLDLNFGATAIIPIDVPGVIRFTNSNALGRVWLLYPHGDRYVKFYQMNISGNPTAQQLELQPGTYEVHYSIANGMPDKIIKFVVKSEETTSIELN